LKKENAFYQIIVNRTREIIDEGPIENYFKYYSSICKWPKEIGKNKFVEYFPYYVKAIDIVQRLSLKLTSTRSGISFFAKAIKQYIDSRDIITLHHTFEDFLKYEESPSGGHSVQVS